MIQGLSELKVVENQYLDGEYTGMSFSGGDRRRSATPRRTTTFPT